MSNPSRAYNVQCGAPRCKASASIIGVPVGLRAVGWRIERFGRALCPEHHPNQKESAEVAKMIQSTIQDDYELFVAKDAERRLLAPDPPSLPRGVTMTAMSVLLWGGPLHVPPVLSNMAPPPLSTTLTEQVFTNANAQKVPVHPLLGGPTFTNAEKKR